MAKINYYKKSITLPKTKEVKSIVGEEYQKDYKTRMEQAKKIAIQKHEAQVDGNYILLSKTEQENSVNNLGDENSYEQSKKLSLTIRKK